MTFQITLTNPFLGFQIHHIFEVEYLKNGESYEECTVIVNHTSELTWYYIWWRWQISKRVALFVTDSWISHYYKFATFLTNFVKFRDTDCWPVPRAAIYLYVESW